MSFAGGEIVDAADVFLLLRNSRQYKRLLMILGYDVDDNNDNNDIDDKFD